MTVKRVKGGFKVMHCHGADAGRPMSKKPKTFSEAMAQHQAIEISKKKRGK